MRQQVCRGLGVSKAALQRWVMDAKLAARGVPVVEDPDER